MNHIFVLGSLNMDFIIRVKHIPKMGETIQGSDFQSSPGGKGSNQAVALAKQGIETYMIGSIGDDTIGDEILKSLNHYGVHDDFIQRMNNQSSGVAMIILEDDDNRIITSAGANACHQIDRIQQSIHQFAKKDDYLLVQLEIPLNVVKETLKTAKKNGMKTVLNAAPIKPLDGTILNLVDLLIVNETEAERLLNASLDNGKIEGSLKQLLELGPSEVICTLGTKGSYYANTNDTIFTPSFKVDSVIDTTGAGDAFIGCFLARRLQDYDIKSSLQYASACGAMTVTKKGVHHAIPSLKEVEMFIQKRGASDA